MPANPAAYFGNTSMDAGTPSIGISSPSPTLDITLPIALTSYVSLLIPYCPFQKMR